MEVICFKVMFEEALKPIRSTPGSAGLDLKSPFDIIIPGHCRKLVDVGIRFIIPYGYYGRIAPRSGLSLNYNLDIAAGVIDRDFQDSIKVLLVNNNCNVFEIKRGDRIAQIIFEKCIEVEELLEVTDSPASTSRGINGFGSTGN